MSSQKKIEANRRNAAKSTGPRTAAGKDASRLNALKHGFYADSPVIIGEDLSLYDALAKSYFDRFRPATPEEHTLVTALIRNAWLLDRLSRVETEIWDRKLAGDTDLGRVGSILMSTLSLLQRRVDSADRAFRRNLELLTKLQAQRAQPETPARGFVPSKPRDPGAVRSLVAGTGQHRSPILRTPLPQTA